MKGKKFHTLQAKLTLLVSMIILTSLIFSFGNFYLSGVINREYTTLIEQNHLMSRYTNALTEYGSALQQYSNMPDNSQCEEEYTKSSEELMQSAGKIYEAFPDPYVENLIYLSENLSGQGRLIMDKRKSGETQEAQQAYQDFSYMNTLLNKYTIYAQQSIERLSVQNMKEVGERQAESQRMMLIAFCSVIILLGALAFLRIRNIVWPIVHLTEMANLVMQNIWDLPRWYGTQKDETGVLVDSFYHMVETIKKQIERLKQQQKIELERKEANEKRLQLEYRNVQLELKSLQNQINPHFLFNCMNMIAKQAYMEKASQTQHITEAIARYLRSVLDQEGEIVTIQQELQQIKNYLDIQELRFGSRFRYQLNCDPQCHSLYVPFMIMQPLVENTVTHGADCCARGIQLCCHIKKEGDSVLIYVEDDGPGMTEEKVRELRTVAQSVSQEAQTTGIGLINVFRRMQLYFHEQVEIFIESTPYTKTVIGFRIPQSGLNQ